MKVDCPECGAEYESEGSDPCPECGFGPDSCDHPTEKRCGKFELMTKETPDPTYIRCAKCGARLQFAPDPPSH